jgi:hypothetical protein
MAQKHRQGLVKIMRVKLHEPVEQVTQPLRTWNKSVIPFARLIMEGQEALEFFSEPTLHRFSAREPREIGQLQFIEVFEMANPESIRKLFCTHPTLKAGAHEHKDAFRDRAPLKEHGWERIGKGTG